MPNKWFRGLELLYRLTQAHRSQMRNSPRHSAPLPEWQEALPRSEPELSTEKRNAGGQYDSGASASSTTYYGVTSAPN
ncbi:hypothetical protein T265_06131 [Opisthorchis viverrini]|uniref:Uncharacterized protein n=1 Tax=Opisthorchis viverrini TaxID=6198 RepID=A0A074ZTC0_OPIVI|nr:hypothetical protein T265_06131 [Opisthorchis viverrini]KER26625.1 hypothetical protein T265_06131 [Opisthorchis viverrini]